MFRENINVPIDPIPVEYTNTLCRLVNEPDYSLTCLGVALLKPRIENYKGITGDHLYVDNDNVAVRHLVTKDINDNIVFEYYVKSDNSDENDFKQLLKDNGFEEKENVRTFLKEKASIDCRAIYHKEKNAAAIIINSRDMKYYHLSISFLSLLYPNIFKDKPMTEEEYDVVKACSKTDKDAFILNIQKLVQPYALEFRKMMLNSLMKAMHEGKISYALEEVNRQRRYINDIQSNLEDAVRTLKQMSVTYEGLKATEKFDDAEEEFVEYLSTKKEIKALRIQGDILYFAVATLLNNYNADAWETFAKRGYIYDGNYIHNHNKIELLDVFKDIENRKILLNNIFCESPEFTVKIASNYQIDLNGCSINCNRNYDYKAADPIFKSYMANPHIKLFACLGGYGGRIPKELRNRNYIGAIELCCASAGSVDLDETEQTFRPFIGFLMSTREKVLKRKDGVDMTPEEALIYLIDKEKNK